ncbi:hypothetical protein P692DRAFT_20815223 [Suillus brevipes Sb2]|nr:hypothetical protein P692DRAFT_20815223 [Suillus brevipes Sb2]
MSNGGGVSVADLRMNQVPTLLTSSGSVGRPTCVLTDEYHGFAVITLSSLSAAPNICEIIDDCLNGRARTWCGSGKEDTDELHMDPARKSTHAAEYRSNLSPSNVAKYYVPEEREDTGLITSGMIACQPRTSLAASPKSYHKPLTPSQLVSRIDRATLSQYTDSEFLLNRESEHLREGSITFDIAPGPSH